MTTRLRKALEDRVLKRRHDHIAEDFGVSEGTIRNLADELIDDIERTWTVRTPRVLGIDDIHIKGKVRTVFVDSENGDILHIADSKLESDVKAGLDLFSASSIEAVTMDMDIIYRPIVRRSLPHATIVFDTFHVVKRVNEMMTSIRLAWEDKRASIEKPKGEAWKRKFLIRRENLWKREQDLVGGTYQPKIPVLNETYELKEDFLELLTLHSSSEAKASYGLWRERAKAWAAGLKNEKAHEVLRGRISRHLNSFIELVDSELDAMFDGLDERLHNARVERANGRIRAIEGVGQGFSYDAIKARALYGHISPSRDLVECDICSRRFSNPQDAGMSLPRSWNAYELEHRLEERFCDQCWEQFVNAMSSTPPGEAAPCIIPDSFTKNPIRARTRVEKRKAEQTSA